MSADTTIFKSFLWVGIDKFGQQLGQMVIYIVLARLLTPDDFGLVAMIMIFFAISQSFIDSGMGQALIRESEISDDDRSTVFWFNFLMSIVFYILIFFTSPYVAAFYGKAQLTELMRVMGISVFFFAVSAVHRAELTQQLNFKSQTYAQLPAIVISGLISILLAFNNYGVWSLVVQYVSFSIISSVILWFQSGKPILLRFNFLSFNKFFGFGYKMLLSGLINTVFLNVYKVTIGKLFLASILGQYALAKRVEELSGPTIGGMVQRVTYPMMARLKDDTPALTIGYARIMKSASLIIFPLMAIIILFSNPIILFVFGDQWNLAASFLKILALSGMLHHIHAINLNLLKVLGRSDVFLKLEIYKKSIVVILIMIGLYFGVYGLLWSQFIASVLALAINARFTRIFLGYSLRKQFLDVGKIFFLTIPMVVIAFLMTIFLPMTSLILFIVSLLASAAVFVLTCEIVKNDTYIKLRGLAFSFLRKI